MKKKFCKPAAACFCIAGMVFQGPSAAYGAWQTNGAQWQYRLEDTGELVKSAWHQTDGGWYRFDENGFMNTGWYLDADGSWYYLNPVSDGTKGKMAAGWHWIDGYCYYLTEKADEKHPLGAMYAGERTPDGYRVDKRGAWMDESGRAVYKPENRQAKQTTVKTGGSRSEKSTGSTITREKGGDKISAKQPDIKDEKQEDTGQSIQGQPIVTGQDTITAKEPDPGGKEERNQVNWQIHFTDSSDHQLRLAPSRSGTAEEGTDLTIYFQTKVIDAQNRIWKSLEKSPYIVTVTGPQNRIIYMEYEQAGQAQKEDDPWKEEREHLEKYIETAKLKEVEFLGENPDDILDSRFFAAGKDSCDARIKSAASRIEPGDSGIFYIIGKNYVPEGSVLAEMYGDDMEYSNTVEDKVTLENDVYLLSRFWLHRKEPETGKEIIWSGGEKRHWQIGDVQERSLDGVMYRFRCIDQNYGDESDRSRQKALFLCDTVIPADTGSSYSYEKGEDGTYGYKFCPGPVVSFGRSGSYKYSHIRSWLKKCEENFEDAAEFPAGVNVAYEGSTKPGMGKDITGQGLIPSYLGSQTIKDRLFILSVDEAIKYGAWLWRFEGSEEENPQSQQTAFCKSYWLRTPHGDEGRNMVYVVDLISKNIRPEEVMPEENSGDEELNATGMTGVRPAFTVIQN